MKKIFLCKDNVLFIFLLFFVFVSMGIGMYFYNNEDLNFENREYNLNLNESINLATVYNSPNVIWETSNDNLMIENNILTAVKSGDASVIGKVSNTKVVDLSIKVLENNENLYIDNHSVQLSMNDSDKVDVIQNKNLEEMVISLDEFGVDDWDYSDNEYDYDVDDNDSDNVELEEVNSLEQTSIVDSDLNYESSNEDVVIVDDYGNITPISQGTAVVTVEDNDGNKDHTYVTVVDEDFKIYASEYSMLLGDSYQIDYYLDDNKYDSDDLVWSSSDVNIVSVDDFGKITSVGEGIAYITVNLGDDISKEIKVKVNNDIILPSDLILSKDFVSVDVGDSIQIDSIFIPDGITEKTIFWTSDNQNIATVSDGKIVGINSGTTSIYATTLNGIIKKIDVIVNDKKTEIQGITLSSEKTNLKVGESTNISYVITPDDAFNKSVTYIYDKYYINLDNNGRVTALRSGTTSITVKTENGCSSYVILNIVASEKINTIKINNGNFNLKVGGSKQLFVNTNVSNLDRNMIKWISSNPKVISVDSNGKVIAKSKGNAVISAISVDNSNVKDSIKINVTYDVKISLDHTSKSITIGKSFDLDAKISPSGASKKVTWKSSNTNIATVNSDGKVTAKKVGTVTITATSKEDSTKSKSCKVTVKDVYTGKMTNPCPGARVTSMYGPRKAPCSGCSSNHKGIDLGASEGTYVVAADGGTVTKVVNVDNGPRGKYVEIIHKKGLITRYQHLSKVLVKENDLIEKGDKIGKVGSTGNVTGPHLHFEVEVNGNTKNPCNYYKTCKSGSELK